MSVFDYKRRHTSTTHVGQVAIGSGHPIRLQSMNNTLTTDVDASVSQALRIADAGADIDRLTAQGVREALCMGQIRSRLREQGCHIPLVADIHFNPKAAFAAAEQVEKVRINPGNFVDPGRVFAKLEYTDEEYAREIRKIDDTFGPFLELCRKNNTAVRIGVNHGSLSDRIMSRYGDTPAGMVESAMEFLRVARRHNFTDIVISIKASNTVVMVTTVRMLVKAMEAENMNFPLHLGVTEAGDGEDGRVRSAVGIGTLLAEGIGDTIRVSLSEEPECEIPVARELVDYITSRESAPSVSGSFAPGYDPVTPRKRDTEAVGNVGGTNLPVVVGYDTVSAPLIEASASLPHSRLVEIARSEPGKVLLLSSSHPNPVAEISAAIHALTAANCRIPVIARLDYSGISPEKTVIRASADFGALLLNGLLDGICLVASQIESSARNRLALGILQAARCRISRTEFVSCPGCGRTLFDLQSTVKSVKEATSHLKGLKIAVMGCIVNGPGEMADADYGYVGAGVGNVSIYRGKTPVEKNIPSDIALERLIALLKADGRWVEP
ncbi:MAG: (E)-4-hydroxy-3-methylbut-2-enyl-diphosphate synthase [Muribaculaceae bacterium]|nr:(E)-4-hydroxy-3-methylbut-2-enyl-diphosphate synthase [Muribaculaceae bacterium]